MRYILVAIAAIALLSGCSKNIGKSTSVPTEFNFGDIVNSTINISPDLKQESKTGNIDGTATNAPNVPVDLEIPLIQSPAAIIKEAVESTILDEVIDSVTPDVEPEIVEGDLTTQGFAMEWIPKHNRSFTWLDAGYKGAISFEFPECGVIFNVPNASIGYEDENGIYFDGTRNKEEESNGIKASVFGPAGCKATKVILKM